jgi:hypothetical protein
MPLSVEVITAIGGALAATAGAIGAAFQGGKKGGENALNGFKEETRESFKGVHSKLDDLMQTDGSHGARINALEDITERLERRVQSVPVYNERRRYGDE